MTTELAPSDPQTEVKAPAKKRTLHRAYSKIPLSLKMEAADMFARKYTLNEIARELHISKASAFKAVKEVRNRYEEKYGDIVDGIEGYLTESYLEGIGLTRDRLRTGIDQLPSDRAGYLMGQYADGLSRLLALPKRSERKQITLERADEDRQTGGRRVKVLVRRDFSEIPAETQKILLRHGLPTDRVIDAEYEESRD